MIIKSIGKSVFICMVTSLVLILASCVNSMDPQPASRPVTEVVVPEKISDFSGDTTPMVFKEIGNEKEYKTPLTGDLTVNLQDAIFMALMNNRSFVVEKLNPKIAESNENQILSKFDPELSGETTFTKARSRRQSSSGLNQSESESRELGIELSKYFPTGTSMAAEISYAQTDSTSYADLFSTFRLGVSMTQALLNGFGSEVNMIDLRKAKLETVISNYELLGFATSLVAETENAFWDYSLSLRQIEIVERSLELAGKQLAETDEMIKVGTLAETEAVAVQAEVASQRQKLINAKSTMEINRLKLLKLLNPPGESIWGRNVRIGHPPFLPEVQLDTSADHVALALKTRPEIHQAELEIQQSRLDIIRTKNGLLPHLDLFITLGKTGYADSFNDAVGDLNADNYDAQIGFTFDFPVHNRIATEKHRRQMILREQAEAAMENLKQMVELDVHTALIEVHRTRQQISAGSATRKLQEEKLRIETEKLRVGRSTGYLVAQAQRELLAGTIDEVSALVYYLKALTRFYRMEGTLLVRRGISASGNK